MATGGAMLGGHEGGPLELASLVVVDVMLLRNSRRSQQPKRKVDQWDSEYGVPNLSRPVIPRLN